LAAAAHLLERGLEPVVFEAGPSAGTALLDCTPKTPQGTCCAPKPELAEDAPCCGSAGQKVPAPAEPAE
jgi:NADPH-dependent 2,4-dienoyl-CoA reductase/sulfur reductase-like enzyme